MEKVIKKLIDIVFVIIIIVLVGYFILRVTGKIDVFEVKTGSMEPTIKINDYIMIYNDKEYKKGDIVTFRYEDTFVTHRIIKINNNKMVTKGDANNVEDDEMDVKSIVGKVILIGGILNFVVNYKLVIVAFMLAIYLFTCYLNGDKKEQGDKNEKEKEKNKA